MNEQERVAYLRSMGYQVYYPRFILPGAKPSPHYEMPVDAVAESVASEIDKLKAEISPSARAGTQVGRNTSSTAARPGPNPERPKLERPETDKPPARSKPVAAKPAATAAPEAVRSAGDELRFSLQYFAVNESLAVINELPHQPGGRQGKEIQELLLAILRALSVSPSGGGLQAEQFNWPLAEGLEVMGDSRRTAGLALQGFISQRQEQDKFQNLLVFTAQLADLLGPNNDKRDEHYGDHGAVAAGYQLCISHSLPAILAHPQLKREVWAHLQALRGRLQAQQ